MMNPRSLTDNGCDKCTENYPEVKGYCRTISLHNVSPSCQSVTIDIDFEEERRCAEMIEINRLLRELA